ncbi:MADS-box transcription factor 23-like [Salvia miltiorrhiza]|uniref:MADS-box transcription factor 23-like n=1 Tax=Salvia miltiorrhiza TaxID=226208 RepID=UPI0025ABA6E9|nr:MADS-box transcription factor 23-like [Salvia miltiorrhiza]
MVRYVVLEHNQRSNIFQFLHNFNFLFVFSRAMEKPNNGKKTMGRRKIEIKKIEKKTSLQVAFSKRRGGLFRKASELAVLCGAEVAILVQSPADKLFAFGHPSVGALIDRVSPSPAAAGPPQIALRRADDGRIKCEEAVKMLEMERRRAAEKEITGGFWWERPHEGMELHELEEFLKALEDFGDKVAERVEEFQKLMMKNSTPPLMHAPIAAANNGGDEDDLIYFHPNMHAPITAPSNGDDDIYFHLSDF